ncbi:divalent ion tolerance protein CutA [Sulfuricella sp. T08]|nr:divalent ion tolerance protein CutA [Sulfuricella sp. T08]
MGLQMEAILVITSLPDREVAQRLAGRLVEERLAACVNILAPCESVYRWQGRIETAQEITLLIKTLGAHYGKVEKTIRQCHPYELPEIIAVPITAGLPAYLEWLAAETINPDPS